MPGSLAMLQPRPGPVRRTARQDSVRARGHGLRFVEHGTSFLPHSDQRPDVASLQPVIRPSRTEGFEALVVSARSRKLTIHKNVTATRMQSAKKRQEGGNCGIGWEA